MNLSFFSHITTPPDAVPFSYIRGLFVYCPFLLDLFMERGLLNEKSITCTIGDVAAGKVTLVRNPDKKQFVSQLVPVQWILPAQARFTRQR